jgi:putative ABC transport system substrate-binding protein
MNVILALGPAQIRAARKATRTIPIVALDLESDPVATGLVDSIARPGGNLTWVFLDLPELASKWVELVKEAVPGLSRAIVLWDPASGPSQLTAVEVAARSSAVEVRVLQMRGLGSLDIISRAIKERPGAMIVLSAPVLSHGSARLAAIAVKHRLPAISPFRAFAEAGGLMAYGPDLSEMYQRLGTYVRKILTGSRPAVLPVERPSRFQLVVNLKTATALGLTMPRSLLLRADEVIR